MRARETFTNREEINMFDENRMANADLESISKGLFHMANSLHGNEEHNLMGAVVLLKLLEEEGIVDIDNLLHIAEGMAFDLQSTELETYKAIEMLIENNFS